jgi:probable HAF family extracellular repeat protein
MRRMWLVAGAVAVAVVLASSASGSAGSVQARWVIRDLGALPDPTASHAEGRYWERGEGSIALAINDRGQIVGGSSYRSSVGGGSHDEWQATLWENGKIKKLPGGQAQGINKRGQIIGDDFLWQNGRKIDLGFWPTAINDHGEVVGWKQAANMSRAFLWVNGKRTALPTLGGPSSSAAAINDRGQIVGSADTKVRDKDGAPLSHAALWEKGRVTDLGTLGGPTSEALDINDRGQIVGKADTKAKGEFGDPIWHAFLWEKGKMTDLGPLFNEAKAINDRGQIVGHCDFPKPFRDDACLWENGKLTDLGTLPRMPDSSAFALNNSGQIVGASTFRAVLWTLRTG